MTDMSSFQVVEPGSFSEHIWNEKYRLKAADGTPIDKSIDDTWGRVAVAIAAAEADAPLRDKWGFEFYRVLHDFAFIPAGRIIAGAGTGRDVTLCNCYVMGTIDDSLSGIMDSLKSSAMTLKQGGGIGMDFSTLRPRGAHVKGVDSVSSGAVSFMEQWQAMCGTIMSAGSRRGAMMGTLRVDHPDIEEFIEVKQTAGRLTNFNVSVLVTDAFMEAVRLEDTWNLTFNGKVYRTVDARDLWNKILKATYEYAEPGVIFIDRMNAKNPLRDIETISATNPCGEQPLPPYGACILGSVNLTRFVKHPFSFNRCYFDMEALKRTVKVATRFLDNVVTLSNYALPEQREEANNKRRIGIGMTGLADALIMMGRSYDKSAMQTRDLSKAIADAALSASMELAAEKGAYPLWNESHGPKRRNSHLTSVAPTGTISCFAGNISSGIEPVFEFAYKRKVLRADGTTQTCEVEDYADRLYRHVVMADEPKNTLIWQTATTISPAAHIDVAAAAQAHVDSAVSKTINCAPDMSFDNFCRVYDRAFSQGMKGCTTYRPSGVRGAVLIKNDETPKPAEAQDTNVVHLTKPLARPEALRGTTYKIKPADGHALYVTVNDAEINGRTQPFEVFFSTKAIECQSWIISLSRMISAVFRKGGDVTFIADELKNIYDPTGGFWMNGKYIPSMSAAIGQVLEKHMGLSQQTEVPAQAEAPKTEQRAKVCPKCQTGALIKREGCWSCDTCSFSKC